MSVPTRAEYNDIKGKLKRRKEEIKNLVALFNAHTEVIKEGFECNRMTDDGFPLPDRPNVCDSRILNLRSTEQSGGGVPPQTQPQTVGDNQPQPDIRILELLENLVRANAILNHPNFNTLPESNRIDSQALYAHYRQQLIQAGYTQQQLNDILQQMQEAGQTQGLPRGGGRKSRKKRGKGAMMSRKKKLSARKPKPRYVDEAIKILENDQTYLIANIVEQGRRIRNLALELEDNAKKGGRRKRKSRRKTKKRRRSRRRKSRRKRR